MSDCDHLFDTGPASPAPPKPPRLGPKRLRHAVRNQVEFLPCTLDELLPDDHEARVVWQFVAGLDLAMLLQPVQAVEGGPGQAPADPRILVSLWLYATLRGIGSARELDRLCREHFAYRWLCGGVSMNYHTLSDFRTAHPQVLDGVLTDSVAALLAEGLVTLDHVAQDGLKVRASAGAASFRRQPTLQEALTEAQAQVATLRQELDDDPAASSARQRAARQRAAKERVDKVQAALDQLPTIAAAKKPKDRDTARASTTDPDARVMKLADGGYRPAYNVQLATDTASQVITGLAVTNAGSDHGQLAPMVEQHPERFGRPPTAMLADGGYAKKADIEQVSAQGIVVYAPVMASKDPKRDAHTPRGDDSPAVAAWRQRMGTAEAKAIYRQRAATAECVNALARNRGLRQLLVRGLAKVKAVALWYALAHNLRRAATLRQAAVAC